MAPPIRIADFKGRIPRQHARLLGGNYAQEARNTRMSDGALGPLREPALIHQFAGTPASFYRHRGEWLSWDAAGVRAVPGPVAQNRLYYTGDGLPKLYDPTTESVMLLRLDAPATAATLTVNGASDPDLIEAITYTFTFVTDMGEESAPAPASAAVNWSPGQTVTVSNFADEMAGRRIVKRRLYRSQTSALGTTDFYFVADIPIASNSYIHNLATHPINEVIPSTDFDTPPDDMQGIVEMPNGMMAAYAGKELLFSEPYKPHAWPQAYRLALAHEIRGIAAFGSHLAIVTEGPPYLAQGSHPSNMMLERMDTDLPCVSSAGLVDLGYTALYPSNDGLVQITPAGAQIVSKPLFTRDQWAALGPETIVAAKYDGRYHFTYQGAAGARPIGVIDLSGELPFFYEGDTEAAAVAMASDSATGRMHMLDATGAVIEWDAEDAEPVAFRWRSKLHWLTSATNYGAILIDTDAPLGPGEWITVTLIADETVRDTITTVLEPVPLPAGYLAQRVELVIEGNATVNAISLADGFEELAG